MVLIDGLKEESLFSLIKNTSKKRRKPSLCIQRQCRFYKSPSSNVFHNADQAVFTEKVFHLSFRLRKTHNFPTTVEPFSGAARFWGEIRDRMAGGTGSIPLAGTAVYMTSYPRTKPNRPWEINLRATGCIKHHWIFYSSI